VHTGEELAAGGNLVAQAGQTNEEIVNPIKRATEEV